MKQSVMSKQMLTQGTGKNPSGVGDAQGALASK